MPNQKIICVRECTFGDPPTHFKPGESIFADVKEAPKHFRLEKEQAAPAAPADDGGGDGGDGGGDEVTVESLAADLKIEPKTVKEYAGRSPSVKNSQVLTEEEIATVTAAAVAAASANQ